MRKTEAPRPNDVRKNTGAPEATPSDALEERVSAFAEQLGRIAGTFQAKAEGWMDRGALARQLASIRDTAAELLEHVAATTASDTVPVPTPPVENKKGRSGGVVDAPGKKHRKPLPPDPAVKKAASQAAKMRMAKPMVKTNRRRGRG